MNEENVETCECRNLHKYVAVTCIYLDTVGLPDHESSSIKNKQTNDKATHLPLTYLVTRTDAVVL